jgi:hypothetical protein
MINERTLLPNRHKSSSREIKVNDSSLKIGRKTKASILNPYGN